MGNEQSGPGIDGDDVTGAGPSAPSTPRPILRNPAAAAAGGAQLGGGGGVGGGVGEEKNRRSVVFRDQTEDALRLNRSIMRAGNAAAAAAAAAAATAGAAAAGQQRATPPGGLARLSQQVNDINGAGAQRLPAAEAGGGAAPSRRAAPAGARTQKPPAPAPPPTQSSVTTATSRRVSREGEETEDSRAARMREHVLALASKREKKATAQNADPLETGGRLYDPSVQELPTVAEEKEEREEPSTRTAASPGLERADSTEALKEEIKQEILSELLSHSKSSPEAASSTSSAHQASPAAAAPDVAGKMSAEAEKRRLIAEIRQQLLGERLAMAGDYADGGTPEPDYPDDTVVAGLPRFASEMELRHSGVANGHYRGPQLLQLQPRRFKGPAPAPPNARYRRSGGGPPVVREPYQAQWEEPIYAYDGAQSPEQQQQLQEQMEKAYDDRYRQKSRSKRFGDSWKRMTASLSKAFGLGSGGGSGGGGGGDGGGGGGRSAGVGRRSSVRDSTFERPSNLYQQQQQHQHQHQLRAFADSRAGSVYSLASAEMPPLEQLEHQQHQQERQNHRRSEHLPPTAAAPADIWRDVAKASHDQMLHTSNPVFGATDLPAADADDDADANGGSARHRGNGHAVGAAAKSRPGSSAPATSHTKSPSPAVATRAAASGGTTVNSHGEQTHL